MVIEIVVPEDSAEVRAAVPHEAIVRLGIHRPGEGENRVRNVKEVGEGTRTSPGVELYAIDGSRSAPARSGGDTLWILCVELGRPGRAQSAQRGECVLR